MKASDLFVSALESEGVEYVFGIPGEENLDLLNSLKGSTIKLILTRHEQAAGFMAATYGRLTGKSGVCMATLGPGATNLVTAAAYAQLGAMPLLMITGQKPIRVSKQGAFQVLDVVGMMRPLTKYTHQVASAHNIPARVREAFRRAEDERPGATHIELPEDIAREQTDAMVIRRSRFERPTTTDSSIEQAPAMIEQARRPLLLIGAGANRRDCCGAVRAFIDKTGIPFFSTQMGKGVVDERHPLFLGNAALSSEDYLHRAIEAADLIINVGHDVVEKPPFIMGNTPVEALEGTPLQGACEAGTARVIHVNFVTATVDAVYHPDQGVIGEMADSVKRLTAAVIAQARWDFKRFMQIKTSLDNHLDEGIDEDRYPLYPQRLVADVRRAMPDDGIIALDNGV